MIGKKLDYFALFLFVRKRLRNGVLVMCFR